MKRWIVLLMGCASLLLSIEIAGARNTDVSMQFAQAIRVKDYSLAQSYMSYGVTLPEIRENSPITSYQLVNSPLKHVKVLTANFLDETLGGERLALIWEITVENNKITNIRTVFDGANPLVDEAKLIHDYQQLFQREIYVPAHFPFEITHFSGEIQHIHQRLVLRYHNSAINGIIQIYIMPATIALEKYKGFHDQFHTFHDGTKVLYRTNSHIGYELRFQKEGRL
ncbi:hypothetical protein [Paenibacillus terrigena]|uniref:hypothetical protein n=1 Tax=Paenibacillus terrigena TaxID=369333 RepID=UPI0012EC8840|nr:hypothetical protein [Paenibacillus terrigena]